MMGEDAIRLQQANLARYVSGSDAELHGAIIRAIARLPREVAEWVVDKCVFFSVGRMIHGQCLPARFIAGAEWIITLDEEFPDAESLVGHEIAHAWLRHSIGDLTSDDVVEEQARKQARGWGFGDVQGQNGGDDGGA